MPSSSFWRYVGILAVFALALSVSVLPFVGTMSLAVAIRPMLSQLRALTLLQYSNPIELVSLAGLLLIVIGAFLALVFFGLRSGVRRTRVALILCAIGLLFVTIGLFDYRGDFVSRIVTTYGLGFYAAWIAVVIGLIAAGRVVRKTVKPVAAQVEPIQARETLIPTGYVALDSMLYGGVPPGSSIVLTGPPCDEKNMIVRRFIETNLDSGRCCIYITNSIDRFRDLLSKHGRDLHVILCHPQANLVAAEYPEVTRLSTVDNLTEINLAFSKRLATLNGHKPSVLCLEILDDVLLDHHDGTRRWLMDILGRSKADRMTCLATLNPAMHTASESQAALETFDGHIDLYEADLHVHPKLIKVKKLGGNKFLDSELLVEREKI